MANPYVFFAGDICWNKCRTKGRTRLLTGGRSVHLCDNCFGSLSSEDIDRLAVVTENA